MVVILLSIVLPIAIAGVLLLLRQRVSVAWFSLAFAGLLGASLAVWWFDPSIKYYDRGPLNAAGVFTYSLPLAIVSIGLVCFPVFRFRLARPLQMVGAFLIANFWLLSAEWIS
jgi:hypothetical protein